MTAQQDTVQSLPIQENPEKSHSGDQDDNKYRYEDGRRYHASENITYAMPDDTTEDDRIHQQHWILKVLSGGNFNSPVEKELEKGIKVLDSGCGPGTWTLEMANTYASSTFYGIDILTRFPEAIKPGNCHFKTQNLLEYGIFPENHFGFIHQRCLIGGLLVDNWEKVIQEHVRTLAPGGWFEALEGLPFKGVQNAGPKYSMVQNICLATSVKRGLHMQITEELEGMFQRAGLVNIQINDIEFPIHQRTQIAELGWDDMHSVFIAMKPMFTMLIPGLSTDEGYNQWIGDIKKECNEYGTQFRLRRIFGQKPSSI